MGINFRYLMEVSANQNEPVDQISTSLVIKSEVISRDEEGSEEGSVSPSISESESRRSEISKNSGSETSIRHPLTRLEFGKQQNCTLGRANLVHSIHLDR
jgi:hypothetical protein